MTASIPKVAADFETSLDQAVAENATTATLLSATDEDGVVLASGLYAFTIDNDTDYKEYIVCQLVGTALTSISNISRQGVVSSGFNNYHRRGASVQITDWAILYRLMANLTGVIDLDASVPLEYDATATISGANMLATKAYVDAIVSGGTVTFDQQVAASQIAGENLTAQASIYFKESDGRWWNTDADTLATVSNVVQGIALSTVTTGNSFQVAISGPVSLTSTVAGTRYYVSSTAGALTTTAPSAPAFVRLVGIGLPSNKLLLCPPSTLAQMSGTVGVPSATNKFVTEAGTSADAVDQSQATQNGTFSAGEADATTRHNRLAQSFVPTKSIIRGVNLYKSANTGTFTGTVTVAIFADSGGSPTGAALATKTITNALYLAYAVGEFTALFTSELTVTPGSLYWVVVSTSTSDTANCINLGTNTAGGYASGSAKYNNTADGWVAISTIDLYFKTLEGAFGKAILGDSTGFVPIGVRKVAYKTGNITLANSATANVVAHGLGRIPNIVEAFLGDGSSSHGMYAAGVYDVGAATYASNGFVYNEATSGGGLNSTAAILTTLNATGGGSVTVTVQVDENVVIFSADANLRTISYKIS